MARIVMGIGTSHSPLLTLDAEDWFERSNDDRNSTRLNTIDGRLVSYAALREEIGEPYAKTPFKETFIEQEAAAQAALSRLADDLERVNPDLVIIIGDDHYELFDKGNMPAFSIYHGDEIATLKAKVTPNTPEWRKTVASRRAMDDVYRFPCNAAFAWELVERLIDKDVDVASAAQVRNPLELGFGHAYGFVFARLFKGRKIPVIPIMLNTYYRPNAPTPKRCYDVGVKLREAIEESPTDLRVAVIASGGLSHFVVEEELDSKIIKALKERDGETLRTLPVEALREGSSEIRCWITMAPMLDKLSNQWLEYIPARRTAAGTGIGLGFGFWS